MATMVVGCALLWFIWRALEGIGEMLFHIYRLAAARDLKRIYEEE